MSSADWSASNRCDHAMNRDLIRTIYLSNAVSLMDSQALSCLLESCNRNNQANGLTGLLIYSDGNFMQVLEGERKVVNATFDRIAHDSRHHHIMRMIDEPIERRHFKDFAMGFRDDSALSAEQRKAFSDIVQHPDDKALNLPSSVRAFIGMLTAA